MGSLAWISRSVPGWPWYPALLASTTVLSLFADFPLQPMGGLRPLLIAFGAGSVVTLIWVPLLHRDRAGIAAVATIAALSMGRDPARLIACGLVILILLVELAWVRRGTMRLRIPWPRVTRVLNIFLVALVAVQLGRAVVVRAILPQLPMPAAWSAPGAAGSRPDVFVVLADGHGRPDLMAQDYGYDMSSFQEALASLGFDESPDSHANHSVTKYSLSALLNGRPLTELGQDLEKPADADLPFEALAPSSATRLFSGAGYETLVVSSGYDHLPLRDVDHYIDVGPRTEIEQSLLETLAVRPLVEAATGGYAAAWRNRMLSEVDEVRRIAQSPSERPQFVFAHLPAPHLPFVMEADCSLRPEDDYTTGEVGRDGHAGDEVAVKVTADQTRCVDTLLVGLLGDLVVARPEAVVIVLSDHGPEERLDWWAPSEPGIRDRLSNLFFARTPGHDALFPDDISLVNVIPILANAYLGTSIPLHPNDLFLGPTPADPHFVPYRPEAGSGSAEP